MILAFVIEPFAHDFFHDEEKQDWYTHNSWGVWRRVAKMTSNRNALTSAVVPGKFREDPLQLQYSRNIWMLIIDWQMLLMLRICDSVCCGHFCMFFVASSAQVLEPGKGSIRHIDKFRWLTRHWPQLLPALLVWQVRVLWSMMRPIPMSGCPKQPCLWSEVTWQLLRWGMAFTSLEVAQMIKSIAPVHKGGRTWLKKCEKKTHVFYTLEN